jgi:hypothetical protein
MGRFWATRRFVIALMLLCGMFAVLLPNLVASPPWFKSKGPVCEESTQTTGPASNATGGSWYWMRSPEQEKVVIAGYYNRYCVRCHGVDGRGVWDIPGVPDFTNIRWQKSRTDAQLSRIILEGRGAVMPPFRGALTLEEAWAMGRYLRTFVPVLEAPRPLAIPPK